MSANQLRVSLTALSVVFGYNRVQQGSCKPTATPREQFKAHLETESWRGWGEMLQDGTELGRIG